MISITEILSRDPKCPMVIPSLLPNESYCAHDSNNRIVAI